MWRRTEAFFLAAIGGIAIGGCCMYPPGLAPITSYDFAEELPIARKYTIYDVDWSPSGDQIAMMASHGTVGQDILIYDVASRTVRTLLGERDSFIAGGVSWSPDGEYLAVSGNYWTERDKYGIWLVPVEGLPPAFLTQGGEVSWSPTGDRLAVGDDTPPGSRLKIVDVASGEEAVVLEWPEDYRFTPNPMPVWSPVPDVIGFAVDELTRDGRYRTRNAYLLDLRQPVPRPLYREPYIGLITDLSWFPDGDWLVLIARKDGDHAYLASPYGDCITRLLPEAIEGTYVDVSPQGDRIVLVRYGHPYILDLPAGGARGYVRYPPSCP